MVEVRYSDRLGNWLFQYSLGRIIAEHLGYSLHAAPIDGFPRTREKVSGRCYDMPTQRLVGHHVSLESIFLEPTPRHVLLEGWFQNYRYYAPHADRVRGWLAWETTTEPATVPVLDDGDHHDDLLMHVRLGDFVTKKQALSTEFYLEMLKRVPHRRAYLAAEDVGDPLLSPLLRAGVIPLPDSLGAAGTIRSADQFGSLVISQATFGWWMGFLGTNIRQIHVGLPEHNRMGSGSLSRLATGLDLRIDEPRYTYYYRAPLIGERHSARLTELPNFCGMHGLSRAYGWS